MGGPGQLAVGSGVSGDTCDVCSCSPTTTDVKSGTVPSAIADVAVGAGSLAVADGVVGLGSPATTDALVDARPLAAADRVVAAGLLPAAVDASHAATTGVVVSADSSAIAGSAGSPRWSSWDGFTGQFGIPTACAFTSNATVRGVCGPAACCGVANSAGSDWICIGAGSLAIAEAEVSFSSSAAVGGLVGVNPSVVTDVVTSAGYSTVADGAINVSLSPVANDASCLAIADAIGCASLSLVTKGVVGAGFLRAAGVVIDASCPAATVVDIGAGLLTTTEAVVSASLPATANVDIGAGSMLTDVISRTGGSVAIDRAAFGGGFSANTDSAWAGEALSVGSLAVTRSIGVRLSAAVYIPDHLRVSIGECCVLDDADDIGGRLERHEAWLAYSTMDESMMSELGAPVVGLRALIVESTNSIRFWDGGDRRWGSNEAADITPDLTTADTMRSQEFEHFNIRVLGACTSIGWIRVPAKFEYRLNSAGARIFTG